MKRVFTVPTITEAYLFAGILNNEGVEAVIKNEHVAGLAGEIPFMEAWPEVWVVHDPDLDRAMTILARYQKD